MTIEWSSTIDDRVNWTELTHLIEIAPLIKRPPEMVETIFRNSNVLCFAYDEQKLIGAGRALSDGIARAIIFDVVVQPSYQGRGIGSQIIQNLIDQTDAGVTMLYAAPGKEGFYQRFGFRKMKTAMAIFKTEDEDLKSRFLD
ncbi:MAG: GNAT family N-acetyltransferase [Gammaproteobacteria bacterium]|nr:GNAT family N-acetyltransferase [Gammaproteobacteria bacterium]MDH5728058.1 GNAT family N-acetyltransferase [Gammaproteobacteria bacterium]